MKTTLLMNVHKLGLCGWMIGMYIWTGQVLKAQQLIPYRVEAGLSQFSMTAQANVQGLEEKAKHIFAVWNTNAQRMRRKKNQEWGFYNERFRFHSFVFRYHHHLEAPQQTFGLTEYLKSNELHTALIGIRLKKLKQNSDRTMIQTRNYFLDGSHLRFGQDSLGLDLVQLTAGIQWNLLTRSRDQKNADFQIGFAPNFSVLYLNYQHKAGAIRPEYGQNLNISAERLSPVYFSIGLRFQVQIPLAIFSIDVKHFQDPIHQQTIVGLNDTPVYFLTGLHLNIPYTIIEQTKIRSIDASRGKMVSSYRKQWGYKLLRRLNNGR